MTLTSPISLTVGGRLIDSMFVDMNTFGPIFSRTESSQKAINLSLTQNSNACDQISLTCDGITIDSISK